MLEQNHQKYSMETLPKYLQWEDSNGKIKYFEPCIIKRENNGHSNAFIAMYALHLYSTKGICYRENENLFRVEASSWSEIQTKFVERFEELVKVGFIQGRSVSLTKNYHEYKQLLNEKIYYKMIHQYRKSSFF